MVHNGAPRGLTAPSFGRAGRKDREGGLRARLDPQLLEFKRGRAFEAGDDGLELIAEIVKKNSTVRIVAMSGGGHVVSDQYLQMARSFGAHVLLRKAFTHGRLLAAVEQARSGNGVD